MKELLSKFLAKANTEVVSTNALMKMALASGEPLKPPIRCEVLAEERERVSIELIVARLREGYDANKHSGIDTCQ